jgi:hypothetical protein
MFFITRNYENLSTTQVDLTIVNQATHNASPERLPTQTPIAMQFMLMIERKIPKSQRHLSLFKRGW